LVLARLLAALPALCGHLYLLFVAVVGWAIFYFEDLGRLDGYLRALFGAGGQELWAPTLGLVLREHAIWLVLAVGVCAPIVPRLGAALQRAAAGRAWLPAARAAANVLLLLTATAMLVGRTYNPFLYFRF